MNCFPKEEMDLVSSTLNKYLKHRFNGIGMSKATDLVSPTTDESRTDDINSQRNGTQAREINNVALDSEEMEVDHEEYKDTVVHNISIKNARPSCCALSENVKFLAIGFENSQIYLYKLSSISPSDQSTTIQGVPKQAEGSETGNSQRSSTTENLKSNKLRACSSIRIEETTKLHAHYGPVYSIEFLRNNDLMLSCSEDTTIRLWCLKTKCNLTIYRGHNYPVWSIVIGPAGEYFASTSMDATARLWRFDRITPLRIFCGHDGDVDCVAFHPNSKYIATGSSDCTVRLWSTSDAKLVRLMIGHKHSINSLSFVPDGKFLASADVSGSIRIWDLAKNSTIADISVPMFNNISFNLEKKLITTCGRENTLQLWKLDKTDIAELGRLKFNSKHIMLISAILFEEGIFVVSFKEDDKQDE